MGERLAFGSWLKERRRELGVSQDELAQSIDVSPSMLWKLEAGERRPSAQIAQVLADYFHIPADERDAFITFARTGRTVLLTSDQNTTTGQDEEAMRTPWRSVRLRQSNLPTPLTPLIGRDREREVARNHLLNPKVRLLTLIGPPGIGKTRLCLHVALDLLDDFEDGVFLVELDRVTEPDMVLPTIARALGLKDAGEQSLVIALLSHVQERRMLLLLDNFEQVLDAAPQVVRLLESSPWLKVLLTSREALHVRGERRLPVPPLAVPMIDEGRKTKDEDELTFVLRPSMSPRRTIVKDLLRYSSVELFVERAQAVAPDFEITEEDAADVAAICVRLEGLPLAIELAAARANHLSPAEMRKALDNPLRVLTAGARDLPSRQRTLRDAIEWSYHLLSDEEQTVFRTLGVFVGGFTAEAVTECIPQAQSPHSALHTPHPDVLDVVLSLADKNLVKHEKHESRGNESGELHEARFGLLEMIREYALEKLWENEEEASAVERAHALYYMQLAEDGEPNLTGPEQTEWLSKLEREHDNLRASLRWAASLAEAGVPGPEPSTLNFEPVTLNSVEGTAVGLRIAGALAYFWRVHGYYAEGREHLAKALALATPYLSSATPVPDKPTQYELRNTPPTSIPPFQALRAKALTGAAILAVEQGDYATGRALHEQNLAILRELGDKEGIARTLESLGTMAWLQSRYAEARALYEESLAIRREMGDIRGVAGVLNNLAIRAARQGDFATAVPLYEESLAIHRQMNNRRGIGMVLNNLGNLALMQGNFEKARTMHEESLAIRRELGDRAGIAVSFNNLADVAYEQRDFAMARALHQESFAIRQELGDRSSIATPIGGLAIVAFAEGDYDEARSLQEESLAIWRELGHNGSAASSVNSLANIAYMQGNYQEARTQYLEALATRKDLGETWGIAITLAGLGRVAVAVGDTSRGVKLQGVASALLDAMHTIPVYDDGLLYEQGIAIARNQLSDEEFNRAWAEGRAMPEGEAISYAMTTAMTAAIPAEVVTDKKKGRST